MVFPWVRESYHKFSAIHTFETWVQRCHKETFTSICDQKYNIPSHFITTSHALKQEFGRSPVCMRLIFETIW